MVNTETVVIEDFIYGEPPHDQCPCCGKNNAGQRRALESCYEGIEPMVVCLICHGGYDKITLRGYRIWGKKTKRGKK